MAQTDFEKMLKKRIEEESGKYIPIKASAMERFTVKRASCTEIHPNPDDEFCFPNVGPSYRIISEYMEEFRKNKQMQMGDFMEPVIVEKTSPDGYMLLNGHHRWAAAIKSGFDMIPIKIVNIALESDLKLMMENSKHDIRVTMDLDEVIFRNPDDPDVEELPKGYSGRKMDKRIRVGIPSLFHHLNKTGYDIWVYSADYYSIDDIQDFFKQYAVTVNGIITGTEGGKRTPSKKAQEMQKLIDNKYQKTVHIDNDLLLITKENSEIGEFGEYSIPSDTPNWAMAVISCLQEAEKNE